MWMGLQPQFWTVLKNDGQIPLQMRLAEQELSYQSAIALKCSHPLGIPPVILAQQVKQQIMTSPEGGNPSLALPFRLQIEPPAWLTLALDYDSLLLWLGFVVQTLQTEWGKDFTGIGIDAPSPIADIQYAHARAWGLLRSRRRARNFPIHPQGDPERYLMGTNLAASLRLPLRLRSLLEAILRMLDEPESPSPQQWQSRGLSLSTKFLDYESQAWQDRKANDHSPRGSALDQYQGNLVKIVQVLLHQILVDQLGYNAPREL